MQQTSLVVRIINHHQDAWACSFRHMRFILAHDKLHDKALTRTVLHDKKEYSEHAEGYWKG
jgi:CRISPR/Cas system CMR-associated protein Cmr1 (group 7 of RAMP superfamily)